MVEHQLCNWVSEGRDAHLSHPALISRKLGESIIVTKSRVGNPGSVRRVNSKTEKISYEKKKKKKK